MFCATRVRVTRLVQFFSICFPSNDFLLPNQIKIIDFGLAQFLAPNKQTRVMFGTPEFISPEIINYEPIGLQSDMWSGKSSFYIRTY